MVEDRTKKLVPFLTKTYDMVEDPNTNELISWNYENETFIIWDHVKLSSLLLPKYFRHDIFSSFVTQLNNYGFRKVNNIPCEYYNKWFQPGRKDLLYNIKKRSQDPEKPKGKAIFSEAKTFRLIATEYKMLKSRYEKLEFEIYELKREQKVLEKQLGNANFEEIKEEEIVDLVMKALSNPSFVQQVKEVLDGDEIEGSGQRVTKKPKLSEEIDELQLNFDSNDLLGYEISEDWSEIEDSAKILPNLNSGTNYALEKMLVDDILILRKESERELVHGESNIMLQLEDLITEPSNLSCDKTSIGEKEDDYKQNNGSMTVLVIAAVDEQKILGL